MLPKLTFLLRKIRNSVLELFNVSLSERYLILFLTKNNNNMATLTIQNWIPTLSLTKLKSVKLIKINMKKQIFKNKIKTVIKLKLIPKILKLKKH